MTNDLINQIIYGLGLQSLDRMLEKIDQTLLLLSVMVDRLEETKKDLEKMKHEKKK